MLRALILANSLFAAQAAYACECFPPKLRAEMAHRSIETATFAIYGQVVAVSSSGEGTLRVIESYKGSFKNAELKIPSRSEHCNTVKFTIGEKALVKALNGIVSGCDKYTSPEPYVLEAYRKAAQSHLAGTSSREPPNHSLEPTRVGRPLLAAQLQR